MAEAPVSTAPARVGGVAGIPTKRIVRVTVATVVILLVAVGVFRTLTLPGAERTDLATWRQLIIAGVALGSMYALIAVGYSLVYGILRLINFAHGEVFMAGAMVSFFAGRAMATSGFMDRQPVLALLVLFAVGAACSMGLAIGLERVAYRPLRSAPRLVPLITAIGASLFLQNSFQGFFGPQNQGYNVPASLDKTVTVLGSPVRAPELLAIGVGLVSVVFLSWFVRSTKLGRSMRAVSEDREIASLMGIDVDRTIVWTFAVGGIFAGVAAVLWALTFKSVQPTMGFVVGITAFTAAVVGGIGSISGAALGGLLIGITSSVAPFLLLDGAHVPSPFQLKDGITFLILILVLIFRPSGLLGGSEKEKV